MTIFNYFIDFFYFFFLFLVFPGKVENIGYAKKTKSIPFSLGPAALTVVVDTLVLAPLLAVVVGPLAALDRLMDSRPKSAS
jgi:hypothetical protein